MPQFSTKARKRVVRYSLLGVNALLLVAVVNLVAISPKTGQSARQSALASNGAVANPLDQLSSSDIAVHAAQMVSMPEATAVVNQADTISGQLALSSADNNIVAKPQIVGTAAKSNRDIQKYVSQPGDTLASVAAKFGVTSDSIRWSNGITSNTLPTKRELLIPPVNGIVHLVKAGDTPESLARDYSANKDSIIAFNDAEVKGLQVGVHVVVPDGTKASAATYGGLATSSASVAWGGAPIYGYNGYDRGWCTYYAAGRAGVPANWGNANTWDNYASRSGWTVSTTPRVGAVAQTDAGGLGHVGIVEEVSPDGSMIIYTDMNGLAGWNKVGKSGWVPARSKFQKFIYR